MKITHTQILYIIMIIAQRKWFLKKRRFRCYCCEQEFQRLNGKYIARQYELNEGKRVRSAMCSSTYYKLKAGNTIVCPAVSMTHSITTKTIIESYLNIQPNRVEWQPIEVRIFCSQFFLISTLSAFTTQYTRFV